MKTILFSLHELGHTAIDLGKQGENKVREIDFDLRDWVAEYPEASAALYISQPNTTVYLAATKMEDGILKWPIINTYTATPGFGNAEIVLSGKDGERLKSATASIFVSESMSEDEQGEAPEYMKPYADQVAENAAKVEKALEEIKNIGTQPGKMPTGGEPGQILAKKSNADYDTHWINPPEGGTGGSDPDAVKSVTLNGTKHEPDEDGNVDLGTIQGWGGIADSIAWDKVTGKPSAYPPSSHTHSEYLPADGTAVNANALNGKDAKFYSRPRNLLENSDFEIAQAGYGGYHGAVIYAADRWMQNDSTVRTYEKVTHNGHGALKCASATRTQQKLYLVEGQTYTGAFYINDKLYLHSFTANGGSYGTGSIWINYQSDGTYMFIISNIPAGGVVSEPVLYPGSYTAANLPPYVVPDPVPELAKCQRCFFQIGTYSPIGNGYSVGSEDARIAIVTPVEMRNTPSLNDSFDLKIVGNGVSKTVTSTTVGSKSGNIVRLNIVSSGLTASYVYSAYTGGTGALQLSADL